VDLVSGALLERSTYLPSGVRETLRMNDDVADVQVEPVGFTGKEADDEVGLTYFGHRYLMPLLGRWASPDPLQVHQGGGGEFGNSYHYVSGNLLEAVDPVGLDKDFLDIPVEQSVVDAGVAVTTVAADIAVDSNPVVMAGRAFDAALRMAVGIVEGDSAGAREAAVDFALNHPATSQAAGTVASGYSAAETTDALVTAIETGEDLPAAVLDASFAWADVALTVGPALRGVRVRGPQRAPAPVRRRGGCGSCGSARFCFSAGTLVKLATGALVAIESIRLGDRVGTLRSPSETPEAERVMLLLTVTTHEGESLFVELLRPKSWLGDHGIGSVFRVELDEMGIRGLAHVVGIGSYAVSEDEVGGLVTGTVAHVNTDRHLLVVASEISTQSIETTGAHRFYSVTRSRWLAARDVRSGEELQTHGEPVVVVESSPVGDPGWVFNIEIENVHEYLVSELEVRAHNTCAELIDDATHQRGRWRSGRSWTRPSGWRLPRNGTWTGRPGHGLFKPNNPEALGLGAGDHIPFIQGVPDFGAWSSRSFRVRGLNGNHSHDMPAIRRHMAGVFNRERVAGRTNWTGESVKTWLSENSLTPHHYRGSQVQLVPRTLHSGVRHHGSAALMRNGGGEP